MEYFKSNNLLSNDQFGFIKGRSVNIQLINLLDKWTKHLDNNDNKGIDVIYTDFEKAFDKVPHKRLIYKLKQYGINNLTLNWIKAYLDNRKHRVRINNYYSDWKNVISGIPQGSILGPFLFIIYINDMSLECNELADILLFADDAKISKNVIDINDKNKLQVALSNVARWSSMWLLSLNIIKCLTLNI